MLRLNQDDEPVAVIRAGVRLFPDGRNPKDGSSLAVTRRMARAMRRRRDRTLRRKARLTDTLIQLGFFPADAVERKSLERLNPYELRARGLDEPLTPWEFGRAVFHLNQRRGFQSNRKTDRKAEDSGAMKAAIHAVRSAIDPSGAAGLPRTAGEYLFRRLTNDQVPAHQRTVRARYRQVRVEKPGGGQRLEKSYDLYLDRALVRAEFNALWTAQQRFDPVRYDAGAKAALDHRLWHQRPLRPVRPGRCTLLPEHPRAPLALPSQQRFRLLQEVNHLRWIDQDAQAHPLTVAQRDALFSALERRNLSFETAIPKLLGLGGGTRFNLEDDKRKELKGNATSLRLAKKDLFGDAWHDYTLAEQDAIVWELLNEESESALIDWLQLNAGLNAERAERVANAGLPEGFGSLSREALSRVLPALAEAVVTYAEAAKRAGFHHSHLQLGEEIPGRTFAIERTVASTGEIQQLHVLTELPYYGEFLQRHVGFADPQATELDPPEKRFGRIPNPTVHIALNQVRVVVNGLLKRYGHPHEVVLELARDLKQNQEQRAEQNKRQAEQQRRNERLRVLAAQLRECDPAQIRFSDIERLILWEELSADAADRRCPYSGVQISATMVLGPEVEVEHILPFSVTLDDGLNNKTLAMRQANRIKGNRTPWQARDDFAAQGWSIESIVNRAQAMPRGKRFRFGEDGYAQWLKGGEDGDGKGFLARALNDTRYMSRVAREYLALVCPQATRVIPGQMTAMLRGKFGLNRVLGQDGEKNRNDHRHHAVDACVIGVTDQGLLQRFARASADARGRQLDRLVEAMPLPWPSYAEHVQRAVRYIWVSQKPDHGHEGGMHNDTAYGLLPGGRVRVHKWIDGQRVAVEESLKVIEMREPSANGRHGVLADGTPRPYKGYKGDSNYCIEIDRDADGKWDWHVISTFDAYQRVRVAGVEGLRDPVRSARGRPLVMRLMIGDTLRAEFKGTLRTLTVKKIKANGGIFVAEHHEANVRQREDLKDVSLVYGSFTANSLRKASGRPVTISPIGDLKDPGFRG
jgi:CRISPR-associated endonuclease Csn1